MAVQLYHGRLSPQGSLEGGRPEIMTLSQDLGQNCYRYQCTVPCTDSGRFGYTARVIPDGNPIFSNTPGLITWAQG